MEDLTPREKRRRIAGISFGALLLAASIALNMVAASDDNRPSPQKVYAEDFTGPGKCLDGSPFDLDEGATPKLGGDSSIKILTIDPNPMVTLEMPDEPAELHFQVYPIGRDELKLIFSDHGTASYLLNYAQQHGLKPCPDQPDMT